MRGKGDIYNMLAHAKEEKEETKENHFPDLKIEFLVVFIVLVILIPVVVGTILLEEFVFPLVHYPPFTWIVWINKNYPVGHIYRDLVWGLYVLLMWGFGIGLKAIVKKVRGN